MKTTRKARKTGRPQKRAATTAALLAAPERLDPRWEWYNRTLLRLRERLRAERRQHLALVADQLESHSMDVADSATDEYDHNLALAKLSAEQDALFEVEQALSRIRSGTYGVCEQSGVKIPLARLRAVPWARFSKDVENQMERRGVVRGPHLERTRSIHESEAAALLEAEAPEEEKAPEPQDERLDSRYTVSVRRQRRR